MWHGEQAPALLTRALRICLLPSRPLQNAPSMLGSNRNQMKGGCCCVWALQWVLQAVRDMRLPQYTCDTFTQHTAASENSEAP